MRRLALAFAAAAFLFVAGCEEHEPITKDTLDQMKTECQALKDAGKDLPAYCF